MWRSLGGELPDTSYLARSLLLLGDAIIGNPPGAFGLIPEQKIDDLETLKRSLPKLLEYDFQVLLLCDGQPVLSDAKRKVSDFLRTLH
jgi:hypothetical protein